MNDLSVVTAKFRVNGDQVAREESNDEDGRDEETHVVLLLMAMAMICEIDG